MNPDGTGQARLTRNKAFDVSPIRPLTVDQILFASNRDEVRDLYLMDADGKNVKRVFRKSAYRNTPVWSPNSKHITYTQPEQGKWFIYITSINDQKEERVAIGESSMVAGWHGNSLHTGWSERRQVSLLTVHTQKQKMLLPKSWNSLEDWFDPVYTLPVSPQLQLLPTVWAKLKPE